MRCKWNVRKKATNDFSRAPAFRRKSGQKPANLEVFLSHVGKEPFSDEMNGFIQSTLSG